MRHLKNLNSIAIGWNIITGIILISLFFLTQSIFSEDKFDPSSVMSRDCASGKMRCGFIPLTSSEWASVPEDPANFIRHRGLPAHVDLSRYMPPIGHQGRQGSCVGWATGYAIKSYHEKRERKWKYGRHVQRSKGKGKHVFSPAFIYNQINRGRDRGSNPLSALRLLQRQGATPWKFMPYKVSNYKRRPNSKAKRMAANYKIDGFKSLNHANPTAIKSVLAKGIIVLAGVRICTNFYRLGKKVYDRCQGSMKGGHAIALVGYDDSKRSPLGDRGAFKIFNSWGTEWGDRGYGWVSYRGMARVGLGAFAVYDRRDSNTITPGKKVPIPVLEKKVAESKMKAPDFVRASRGVYSNVIYVSWKRVNNAVAYSIQRAEPGGEEFFNIGHSRNSIFRDAKVQPDVSYQYRIVTIGENGSSNPADSPVAEGYAKSKINKKPDRVTSLRAGQNIQGNVVLSWNKAAKVSSYKVIRYNFKRKRWQTIGKTRSTHFKDRRPVRNNRNYYRVQAKNRSGSGQWSRAASVNVSGRETPPNVVTGLLVSSGVHKRKIKLKWNRVHGTSFYGVFRYNIEKRRITGVERTRSTFFTDTSEEAVSGRKFGYLVAAFNKAGRGNFSNYVTGYSSPNKKRGSVLPAPKKLTGIIYKKKGTITLKWTRVKKSANYYIYRKRAGEKKYKFIKSVAGNKTTYTEKIQGSPGTVYLYTVRSKSLFGGESANSMVVSAFINKKRMMVRHRFFGNDGFEKFKGTWTATDWDGESAPKKISLTLTRDGKKFKGTMTVGEAKPKKFSGTFIARGNIIESDGFRMQLVSTDQGVSNVELSDADDEQIQLSFTKE